MYEKFRTHRRKYFLACLRKELAASSELRSAAPRCASADS